MALPVNGTVGDSQDVICVVKTTSGLDPSVVSSTWTGPNGGIVNDDRVTVNRTLDNNTYITVLHFKHLLESDKGIYTCNMTTNDHNVSLNTNLNNLTSKLKMCTHDKCTFSKFEG